MSISDAFCARENTKGVRCVWGATHTAPCSFKSCRLTDRQVAMLAALRACAPQRREFVVATMSDYATVKAVAARGFVEWRYINSRTFDAWLTEAGAEQAAMQALSLVGVGIEP